MRGFPAVLAIVLVAGLAPPASAAPELVKLGDFDTPVHVAGPPGDASRVFVVEQPGRIQLLVDGQRQATPFLDATARRPGGRRARAALDGVLARLPELGPLLGLHDGQDGGLDQRHRGQIQIREYRRADADHAVPSRPGPCSRSTTTRPTTTTAASCRSARTACSGPAPGTAAAATTTRCRAAHRARHACSASCMRVIPTPAARRRCGPPGSQPVAVLVRPGIGDLLRHVGQSAIEEVTGPALAAQLRLAVLGGRQAVRDARSVPGAVPPPCSRDALAMASARSSAATSCATRAADAAGPLPLRRQLPAGPALGRPCDPATTRRRAVALG